MQKIVVTVSINQQCNALESIVGIFLYLCNTHEKVIKMLAKIGISISLTSIHDTIHSLSHESVHGIHELGQTLLTSYTYDNFNIKLNTLMPMVEQSTDSLVHLTSGIALQLDHGVTLEHLQCSAELWDKSPLNDDRQEGVREFNALEILRHLTGLYPEISDLSGLSHCGRYNRWQFLYNLVHHGPVYF